MDAVRTGCIHICSLIKLLTLCSQAWLLCLGSPGLWARLISGGGRGGGVPVRREVLSNVSGLHPPNVKVPPSCDNQTCLQTLPNVLGGTKTTWLMTTSFGKPIKSLDLRKAKCRDRQTRLCFREHIITLLGGGCVSACDLDEAVRGGVWVCPHRRSGDTGKARKIPSAVSCKRPWENGRHGIVLTCSYIDAWTAYVRGCCPESSWSFSGGGT